MFSFKTSYPAFRLDLPSKSTAAGPGFWRSRKGMGTVTARNCVRPETNHGSGIFREDSPLIAMPPLKGRPVCATVGREGFARGNLPLGPSNFSVISVIHAKLFATGIRFRQHLFCMGHNEQVFADFIKECGDTELKTDWVLWMLGLIGKSNRDGLKINPDYLRSRGHHPDDTEPTMAYCD